MNWRMWNRHATKSIEKPEPINPLRLVSLFEHADETGHLSVPEGLAKFAAQVQELNEPYDSITYLKMEKTEGDKNVLAPSSVPDDAVLLPFSGGFSSTAALWQLLREGRQVWLFYLEYFSVGEPNERVSIRRSIVSARDCDGLPLLYQLDDKILARLVTLPAAKRSDPKQPHIDMLLLFTQAVNVMKAYGIKNILWSGFYEQRPMLTSLAEFFSQRYDIKVEFTENDRLSAFAELVQAAEQSSLTDTAAVTAGATLGNDILNRCFACSKLTEAQVKLAQKEVPSPLAGVCGNCPQCLPWIELAIRSTSLPVQRLVAGFGINDVPAKPKAKKARPKAKPKAKQSDKKLDSSEPSIDKPKRRAPAKAGGSKKLKISSD